MHDMKTPRHPAPVPRQTHTYVNARTHADVCVQVCTPCRAVPRRVHTHSMRTRTRNRAPAERCGAAWPDGASLDLSRHRRRVCKHLCRHVYRRVQGSLYVRHTPCSLSSNPDREVDAHPLRHANADWFTACFFPNGYKSAETNFISAH